MYQRFILAALFTASSSVFADDAAMDTKNYLVQCQQSVSKDSERYAKDFGKAWNWLLIKQRTGLIENIYMPTDDKMPITYVVKMAGDEKAVRNMLSDHPFASGDPAVPECTVNDIGPDIPLAGMTTGKTENKAMEKAEGPVTLINPFVVSKDKAQEAIVFWEHARDFLKKEPGYISTQLHQTIQDNATFYMINVAKWKSSAEFKAATQKMRKELKIKPIEGVQGDPALYTVIRE